MSNLKDLEDRLLALEKRMEQLESIRVAASPKSTTQVTKELSVKEFMLEKRPSNDVEKTLTIGYFLEKHSGQTSFNVDDISRHFQLAKEAIPQNINDKINMNIKKGHISLAREKKGNKKAWLLTNSGEKFVENGFTEIKK